jgi:hypothetical protein
VRLVRASNAPKVLSYKPLWLPRNNIIITTTMDSEYGFRGCLNIFIIITTRTRKRSVRRMPCAVQTRKINLLVVPVPGVRRRCLLPEGKGTGMETVLEALTRPRVEERVLMSARVIAVVMFQQSRLLSLSFQVVDLQQIAVCQKMN